MKFFRRLTGYKKESTLRCHVCDEFIENIQDDPKQPGKLLPCAACMDAISDVVYDDEPEEDLDEIVYEDIECEDLTDDEEITP